MEQRECASHPQHILDSFQSFKDDEKFCDFTLKIGDEEIRVHRMVLAASSKYYEAMFSHDTKETKTGRAEIRGIEPNAGKQCIDYVYTGKIEFSCENPQDLIHAAELMQLHSLIDLYFDFLIEKLSVKNCLEYMQLAEMYNRHSFAKIFEKFSVKNFTEIVDSDDFLAMKEELLSQCLGSLANGGQELEISKWEAILKWVSGDAENRKGSFPKLFRLINLEILPDVFIKKQIHKEPIIKQFPECEIHAFAALCDRDEPLRRNFETEEATHIVACHLKSRLLQGYNVKTKKWSRISRIPSELNQAATDVVSLGGDIFVGSGISVSKFSAGKWTKMFDRSDGQICYCRFAAYGSSLCLIANDFIVKYDSGANTWKEHKMSLNLGDGFAVAASQDHIFAVGGDAADSKGAKELDVAINEVWEPIASMNFGRKRGSAVFFGGKLLTVGGYDWFISNPSNNVEFYKENTDTWTTLSNNVQCNNYDFKAFILEGALYIVGGVKPEFSDKIVKIELPENIDSQSIKLDSTLTCVASIG